MALITNLGLRKLLEILKAQLLFLSSDPEVADVIYSAYSLKHFLTFDHQEVLFDPYLFKAEPVDCGEASLVSEFRGQTY